MQGTFPASTGQVEHLLTPGCTTAQRCSRSLAVPADLKHKHDMYHLNINLHQPSMPTATKPFTRCIFTGFSNAPCWLFFATLDFLFYCIFNSCILLLPHLMTVNLRTLINMFLTITMLCLLYVGTCSTPCVGNLMEVKSCMYEISRMAFLVTSVSMFHNFIPTFPKPDTFTFANIIIINCLSTKKLPYMWICK
jgi:hypothetical protein